MARWAWPAVRLVSSITFSLPESSPSFLIGLHLFSSGFSPSSPSPHAIHSHAYKGRVIGNHGSCVVRLPPPSSSPVKTLRFTGSATTTFGVCWVATGVESLSFSLYRPFDNGLLVASRVGSASRTEDGGQKIEKRCSILQPPCSLPPPSRCLVPKKTQVPSPVLIHTIRTRHRLRHRNLVPGYLLIGYSAISP